MEPQNIEQAISNVEVNPKNSLPGLYIHVPFCHSKCPYCAFFSIPSKSLIPKWLKALQEEVMIYWNQFNRFDSLYIGGGTPTVLTPYVLGTVVCYLKENFQFASDSEVTIEANPLDLNHEMIRCLIDLGFNRISLGVQSFDDKILHFLGRRHSAEDAKRALKDLTNFGFENISIDLIYGIPGQTMKVWIKTLEKVLEFNPRHLSCYQLSFDKKTVFDLRRKKGEIKPISEKLEEDFFLTTSRFLEDQGYLHYEISSFALTRANRSQHNLKYWNHTPYLGLGPSAHSFHQPKRWWNVRSIRSYCNALENGETPVEAYENLTKSQLLLETIALGCRTNEGFSINEIAHETNIMENISILQEKGYLNRDEERILPTKQGFLMADQLPIYILD